MANINIEQLTAVFPALDPKSVVGADELNIYVVRTTEGARVAVGSPSGEPPEFKTIFEAAAMLMNIACVTSRDGFEKTLERLDKAAMSISRTTGTRE